MTVSSPELIDQMNIEQFVAQSEGQWRSMRSGHSLAFQYFEDVLSEITIEKIDINDSRVQQLVDSVYPNSESNSSTITSPFRMEWSADSDWEPDDPSEVSQGSCIIVPISKSDSSGELLRSVGYAESETAKSKYRFLDDGTFILTTQYEQSIAEERIWFASENVRCRSSILKTSAGSGILQASFASEVRRLQS